jgi:hypothetical protein
MREAEFDPLLQFLYSDFTVADRKSNEWLQREEHLHLWMLLRHRILYSYVDYQSSSCLFYFLHFASFEWVKE